MIDSIPTSAGVEMLPLNWSITKKNSPIFPNSQSQLGPFGCNNIFFSSFSYCFYVYAQPVGLWQTLSVFNNTWFFLVWCTFFLPFLLNLAAIDECDFWAMPSWVYPSRFSSSGSVSVSILAPTSSPLLFLLILLFSKFLIMAPTLLHRQASRLNIFSQLRIAI